MSSELDCRAWLSKPAASVVPGKMFCCLITSESMPPWDTIIVDWVWLFSNLELSYSFLLSRSPILERIY